ncbi:MAG TPA: transglycosylase SLT domain-containing protein [Pseudomonadales bacterium]
MPSTLASTTVRLTVLLITTLVSLGAAPARPMPPPAGTPDEAATPFPRPEKLRPAVAFWTRVYSEVDTDGGLIHDARYLDVVYEVVRFPPGTSPRTQRARIDAATARYRKILEGLAAAPSAPPADAEAARVAALWKAHGAKALAEATGRVRFQRGQADRFRAGLARSGAWRAFIAETLREAGVPEALAALPHVESSFDPTARSHADARGLWQFTVSTGRRYMQIDHVVDERLDPWLSSRAAAQLLRHNYEVTGSWPLAITAYNHGLAGMRRAVEQLGTKDIGTIAWDYRGRAFGFASRNFYAAFLAAVDVEARAEELFGPIRPERPPALQEVIPDDYLDVTTLAKALGVESDVLRRYNPAVLAPVWNGTKRWPRGLPVRLPARHGADELTQALAAIPAELRYAEQIPDQFHRVARGEALSLIAARYGTTVRELAALNGLRDPHRVRAGSVLRLPGAPAAEAEAQVAALELPEPAAQPTADALVMELASELAMRTASPPSDGEPAAEVMSMSTGLGADPSDLEVDANGRIEIQPLETLGHYAEWLGVSVAKLRSHNGLKTNAPLVVGRRLKVDVPGGDPALFEARRRDYHRLLQETFFARFHITGTREHRVRKGESLWLLTRRYPTVPMWLMRQYNPDVNFAALQPGMVVAVPVLAPADATADG